MIYLNDQQLSFMCPFFIHSSIIICVSILVFIHILTSILFTSVLFITEYFYLTLSTNKIIFLFHIYTDNITNGFIQLENSPEFYLNMGRLAIYYNGSFGGVCDNTFVENASNVACNELGYEYGGSM